MKYLAVIEMTDTGFSAYLPDLHGCVATGTSQQEVVRNMHAALEFDLDGMRTEGLPVPTPRTSSRYVEVPI